MAMVFARNGWRCALGAWVSPESAPRENFALYSESVEALAGSGLTGYLSVKLASLGYDQALFGELVGAAARRGVRIHCDSVGPESVDRTMDVLEKAGALSEHLGSTLPAGWRRSPADAEKLAALGVAVRIVKGQWGDPERRVGDLRAAFVGLAGKLSGRGVPVSVATHDRVVARRSLDLLTRSGTDCELEQISGLPLNCAPIASEAGVPFRVYIPFGYPYLPYNIWQIRTRPVVALWALRDFIAGRHRSVR